MKTIPKINQEKLSKIMNLTTKFEKIEATHSKKEKENFLEMNNNNNYYKEAKIDKIEKIQSEDYKLEIENNNKKHSYLEDMDEFLKNHLAIFQKISIEENDSLMEEISKNLTLKNIMVYNIIQKIKK